MSVLWRQQDYRQLRLPGKFLQALPQVPETLYLQKGWEMNPVQIQKIDWEKWKKEVETLIPLPALVIETLIAQAGGEVYIEVSDTILEWRVKIGFSPDPAKFARETKEKLCAYIKERMMRLSSEYAALQNLLREMKDNSRGGPTS